MAGTNLVLDENLQKSFELLFKDIYVEVHAIYEPDRSMFFGDCYCATVDLFASGLTFRIYFKEENEKFKVEWAERCHFG